MSLRNRLRRRPGGAAPSTGPATGSSPTRGRTATAERPAPARPASSRPTAGRGRLSAAATSTPVLLLRAAHPRAAVLTALGLAAAAALTGRPLREIGLVLVTVLVGQAILGWVNDLVDRARDRRHEVPGKPIAAGLLDPGTVWFTATCALLLVVPLSISAGPSAGTAYLLSLLIGLVGQWVLRRGALSFVPWLLAFALYPAYLAYGGWGGQGATTAPSILMTVLAALLGVCVHVLRSLSGLVRDHQDDYRTMPLRIALRTGAPRLLVLAGVAAAVVVLTMLLVGQTSGLT